jgi:hypothetical protein
MTNPSSTSSPKRPWGINTIGSMIGSKHTTAGGPQGPWYRAVPAPYYTFGIERLRAAWWVLTGKAHAVVWPRHGDLERALEK